MPFTISHPAAVLPLKLLFPRYFSLTGLMAGAISPDLLYFLTLTTAYRGFSHTWSGLFIFCLPAGIIFSLAFHRLFKFHVIMHLPRPFDRILSGLAFEHFRINGRRTWIILAYSVLLGALSHFAWDSFTHPRGEMTKIIPLLLEKSTILGITRMNCIFIHRLSTVLGAVFVLLFVLRSRYLPDPVIESSLFSSGRKIRFWLMGTGLSTIFAIGVASLFGHIYGWRIDDIVAQIKIAQTFGLAGWAGFFYFVSIFTLLFDPGKADLNTLESNHHTGTPASDK
jgi:hypothetical protein